MNTVLKSKFLNAINTISSKEETQTLESIRNACGLVLSVGVRLCFLFF